MNRLIALSLVAVAVAGFLTLLADEGEATTQESSGAKGKPYEMVAELSVVMGYVEEIHESIPESVKANRLRKIGTDAVFLAELANVSSHAKEWREEKGYAEYMKSMLDDYRAMSEAAKKKDGEKVTALHKKITGTCDTCHEKVRDA